MGTSGTRAQSRRTAKRTSSSLLSVSLFATFVSSVLDVVGSRRDQQRRRQLYRLQLVARQLFCRLA